MKDHEQSAVYNGRPSRAVLDAHDVAFGVLWWCSERLASGPWYHYKVDKD